MPTVQAIPAVTYAAAQRAGADISALIAPPYDVLDEGPKQQLLARNGRNIVAIDLPFTPPKTVGPDAVYERAGQTYRQWLSTGVLTPSVQPAVFVYQQTYTHSGRTYQRRGLIANVKVQPFGPSPDGGGIFAHENTIAGGKEDRLKLMRACRAQLSPIFGIYDDPTRRVAGMLEEAVASGPPAFFGVTAFDAVRHDVWRIDDPRKVQAWTGALSGLDVFVADGHHRYNTALNYQKEVPTADACMFVLVSMRDEGMIVLPTHRVITGLRGLTLEKLQAVAEGFVLSPGPIGGKNLDAVPHGMGLYDPATQRTWVIGTRQADPLAKSLPHRHQAWRRLDVAVLHELLIERVLKRHFGGEAVGFKYTADLEEMKRLAEEAPGRLGVVMRPTPLESVRAVSLAGELMPPKSTFFYPKLATGLVINPLG